MKMIAGQRFHDELRSELAGIEAAGLLKRETVLQTAQGAWITVDGPSGSRRLLNLCANNYLGLAAHPAVIQGAIEATSRHGAGLASVRFICGTHGIHRELESAIAGYLGFEDAILYPAAFDANGGVFEPLLDERDAIVSDSLNHASIIDGVRLCKARRLRYPTGDMDALEAAMKQARASGARRLLIATDGVFSMDGTIANLAMIAALADRYEALLLVDDCHATGVLGNGGRGTPAACDVEGRVDILVGTFGKALGGAMGGFICARKQVVELLRQRSRPYLFSNALAPGVCGAALAAIDIARGNAGDQLRRRLHTNAHRFRAALAGAGFNLMPGDHPIIPVLVGEAGRAQSLAGELLRQGVHAVSFTYPVVPNGTARIRTQMSAALSDEDVDFAGQAFARAGETSGLSHSVTR